MANSALTSINYLRVYIYHEGLATAAKTSFKNQVLPLGGILSLTASLSLISIYNFGERTLRLKYHVMIETKNILKLYILQ